MTPLVTWDAAKQAQYQQQQSSQLLTIHFLLDYSTSMAPYRANVIEGYDRYLTSLKQQRPPLCLWEHIQFNHDCVRVPILPLQAAVPLSVMTYEPFGSTALYDALGGVMTTPGADSRHLLILMTDGEDVYSTQWTLLRCAEVVKTLQDAAGWTFVYLAAYPDGLKIGRALGIPDANCKIFPGEDLPAVFRDLAQQTTRFLAARDPVRGYLPSRTFFTE